MLFKGYIATNKKKPLQKFGNGEELLNINEARKFDGYAGVLADDTVLIDIDDKEQSEILMDLCEELQLDCKVVCTSRGRHFYFKDKGGHIRSNKQGARLALGLTADIKIGNRNSYGVLKLDGDERFVEWDIEENGAYGELPAFLRPIKTDIDFLNLGEGDGRNSKMFSYILTLVRNGFTKQEIRDTLRAINQFILKKPLSASELETICRDESFPETNEGVFFQNNGEFMFDKFAKWIIDNNHIVKLNGQLHIYKDGIYIHGGNELQSAMIKAIPRLNRTKRMEVLSYMELLTIDNPSYSDSELIAFKNGVYDIDTGELLPFSPDHIITNKINWDYNPEAHNELVDKTLDKLACGNKDTRLLLEEVVGYTFYRRNELRKAFILVGDKRNGKSTYLDMITTLLGHENTVALDLKELSDRFKTAEIYGKLANIGDDIDDEFLPNASVFKKIVTGDRINAERKGQDPFDFSPYVKLLFSANAIPRIKDKSGAVVDRLIVVPFEAVFSRDDPDFDPYIKYKLREKSAMEYLLLLGLQGLRRVLDNREFTMSEKVVEGLKEYAVSNSPILAYFEELDEEDIIGKPAKKVYSDYCGFCLGNNLQAISNIEFSKQVNRVFNSTIKVIQIDGKSTRIFSKKSDG